MKRSRRVGGLVVLGLFTSGLHACGHASHGTGDVDAGKSDGSPIVDAATGTTVVDSSSQGDATLPDASPPDASSDRAPSDDGPQQSDAALDGPPAEGSIADAAAGDGASPDAAALAPAFYVATTGNDMNPGTLALPFATLGQAQKAMRASSSIKTTYVRAGTYTGPSTGGNCVWGNPAGSSIALSSADDGETWSYYPPDGYGSAVLDGQSTMGTSGPDGGNGIGCAFGASQVTGITIVGLQFQNYLYSAIWGWAVTDATVTDNVIHDTKAAAFSTAGIYLVASPGVTVAHNELHDLAYMGIVIADNSTNGGSMSNATVASNALFNVCTWPAVTGGGNDMNGGDCGAIYFWSQVTSTSTNMRVSNNLVRDVNASSNGKGDFGSCCGNGVYLDDGTNNVTVTGNVVTGTVSNCFMIHGGQDNAFTGNVCDLGSLGTAGIVLAQNDDMTQMTGNVFENNVVVAGSSGPGAGFVGDSPPNPITIENNAYFNYVGTMVTSTSSSGAGSDRNPTYENPGIGCWAPTLMTGSPVLAAPVSLPGIPSGWGPPGFVLPQTGTAPSWPHGC